MHTEIKTLLDDIENHLLAHERKMRYLETDRQKNHQLNHLNIKLLAILEGIRQIIAENNQ